MMKFTEEKQRVFTLERGDSGFGFVLCCENDTTDTYVLHVLKSSPACEAGLRPGDRIIEINETNVEKETHQDVVKRLQGLQILRLVVAHNNTAEEYFKDGNGMTVKPLENGGKKLRPKLINIKRGENGFDFTLQTMGKTSREKEEIQHRTPLKGISGHYASLVRAGGVAFEAGLREGNRIVQLNGIEVNQESHAFVIAMINNSEELKLLVVDRETDEFFQTYGVCPGAKHLQGEVEFNKTDRTPKTTATTLNRKGSCGSESFQSKSIYNRQCLSPPSSHAMVPPVNRLNRISMARSTPNLTAIGIGRSKSWGSGESQERNEISKFRQSAAKAKQKIKKQLSKLERKPSKSNLYKVSLSEEKQFLDETTVSDDVGLEPLSASTTSSHPTVEQVLSNLSLHNRSSLEIGPNGSDVSNSGYPLHSYKPVDAVLNEKPMLNYQSSDCGSSPSHKDSIDELASIGYKVDLKTLKEHVKRKSNRTKTEIIKSKSKLSDYSLAHMYVNSY